jgi:hypothetical protein
MMNRQPVSPEPSEDIVRKTIEGLERLLSEEVEREDRAQRRVVASRAYERLVCQEICAGDYAREIRRSVQNESRSATLRTEHEMLLLQYRTQTASFEPDHQRGLRIFLGMFNRFLVIPLLVAAGVAAIVVRGLAHLMPDINVGFVDTWIWLIIATVALCTIWHIRREFVTSQDAAHKLNVALAAGKRRFRHAVEKSR